MKLTSQNKVQVWFSLKLVDKRPFYNPLQQILLFLEFFLPQHFFHLINRIKHLANRFTSSTQLFSNLVQGPRTQIDAFQTNIFSWLNDILTKRKLFLETWDREIWYKTFSFYFINLTWPPQPQKGKVAKNLQDVGMTHPW